MADEDEEAMIVEGSHVLRLILFHDVAEVDRQEVAEDGIKHPVTIRKCLHSNNLLPELDR